MDIWVVSYLFAVFFFLSAVEYLFPFLLGVCVCVYLEVKLQEHMVVLITVGGTIFLQWMSHFPLPPAVLRGTNISKGSPILVTCHFLKVTIPVVAGMKWYLIVVLISVSLASEWVCSASFICILHQCAHHEGTRSFRAFSRPICSLDVDLYVVGFFFSLLSSCIFTFNFPKDFTLLLWAFYVLLYSCAQKHLPPTVQMTSVPLWFSQAATAATFHGF